MVYAMVFIRKWVGVSGCVTLTAWSMVFAALIFQYIGGLEPCVQCVYQRLGSLLVAIFATCLWISRHNHIKNNYRNTGISSVMGLASAVYMEVVSSEHLEIQNNTNPFFATCSGFPEFPFETPLDKMFPFYFEASGPCGDVDWSFLGVSMPGWVNAASTTFIIVFACYVSLSMFHFCKKQLD
jgi:disulfide bond formation protein DsbB